MNKIDEILALTNILFIFILSACMDYMNYQYPKDAPNLNGESIYKSNVGRNNNHVKAPVAKSVQENSNCDFDLTGDLKVPEFGFKYKIAGKINIVEDVNSSTATLKYLTFDNKEYLICPVTTLSYFVEDTRFEFKFKAEMQPEFMREAPPGLGFDPGGKVKTDVTIKGVFKDKNVFEGSIAFYFHHPLIGPFSNHIISNFTGNVIGHR